MEAVILAAGKGSRITEQIGMRPKSTLRINGESIIAHTVHMLLKYHIKVTVCTGFREEMIRGQLAGLPVTYKYNPFYEVMNNMGTFWWARDVLGQDDVLILSADVVFEEAVLERMLQGHKPLVMAADETRIKDGDYFLKLDECRRVIQYGPDLPESDRDCEYVGICKVSKAMGEAFRERLEHMVNQGLYHGYLETVFFSFISQEGVDTCEISGLNWREIDRYEDYEKAVGQFETEPAE